MQTNMDDNLNKSQVIAIISVSASFMIKEEDSCVSSSSSDESEVSSDEEKTEMSTLFAILMVGNTRGVNIPNERIIDYVERVVPDYSRQFKEYFRMFPETYEMILDSIGPALYQTNAIGRKQIHPSKQLLITLWFLATPDSYRYFLFL
ncbi:uncharacterized protein LOC113561735 [Ooceraea biroi]|uniref:uncharacterized protein LOC113561735 n=1 Tax=Ooceraea biroi TaxID=2015173 RepID=UPI000F07C4EA|nr:uncharacterized protein LOC113561735 [Ooceraea biroi]